MITVHHLNNSRSQRVLWLLEELGQPYEVKRYEREPSMAAPDSLKSVHPLGKSPVVTDGDLTIAETGAIVDYLIATYGGSRLIPTAGTPERLRYNYWLHYAEGSAMPLLVMKLIFGYIPKAPQMPFFIRPVAGMITGGFTKSFLDPQLKTHVRMWEDELAKSAYFAGNELTGADIMMSFPLEATSRRGGLGPRSTAYLAGIHASPAYQAALARGGPYQLLG